MQFLKTAFWAVLAVVIALFSYANWKPAEISLWGDLLIVTPLPIVAIVSFLIGVVPMWLLHKATHWSMRRRLDSAERALASVKPAYPSPPPPLSSGPVGTDDL